jgi:hypothetical protein
MSALVSSTSPQLGHEALMVVTPAISFPSYYVRDHGFGTWW